MNRVIVIAFGALLLMMGSCHKKDGGTSLAATGSGNPSPNAYEYRIKSEDMLVDSLLSRTEYTYASNGKVEKIAQSNGVYSLIEWQPSVFSQKSFSINEQQPVADLVYYLDAAGNATAFVQPNYQVQFEYNNGFLKKMSYTGEGMNYSQSYVYLNGNLTETNSSDGSSVSYEYYTDKLNTIGPENKGNALFGKQNRNLLRRINHLGPGNESHISFTYEFDGAFRVKKMFEINPIDTVVYEYTYY